MLKFEHDIRREAWNFKTGRFETVDLKTLPPERLREFMPQDANVQNIFTCYLHLEETPLLACQKTLESLVRVIKQLINE